MASTSFADVNAVLNRLNALLQDGAFADAANLAAGARLGFPMAAELARLHGIALMQLGRIREARMALVRAAELAPESVETQCSLASIALADGGADAAIERMRATLRRAPDHPAALQMLGTALMVATRYTEARDSFAQALQAMPQHPALCLDLANAELQLGHVEQAEARVRDALQIAPGSDTAHALLAQVLQVQGRSREAVDAWLQAERLDPRNAQYPCEAGRMLEGMGKLEAAADAFDRALRVDPNHLQALGRLVSLRRRLCDWRELDTLAQRLRQAAASGRAIVNPSALLSEDVEPAVQQRAARAWAATVEQRLAPLRRRLDFTHPRPPLDMPIRVGFVADGFNEHATGLLVVALLEALPGNPLELHLFATTPDDGGPTRRRLAAAARLHDVSTLKPAQVARRIHAAGIEILFDLNGYRGKDGAELMALRAAPLQVGWLACPGTSGAPWMDYLLADAVMLPDSLRVHVREKLLRLPRCCQPSDTTRIVRPAPARADCGLPAHGTVFACFNGSHKLNAASFGRMTKILQQVHDSVLWLCSGPEGADDRLREAAAAAGIAPERLVFMPRLPHLEYLARYNHADLCLDTLPCTAHATASDALWAGCPLLTCRGHGFAGRIAASLLHHLDMPELVCENEDAFIATAVLYGNDRDALDMLRLRLAMQRANNPLFDMQGFAADFRRMIKAISARYRSGRPAADLDG
ncbi:O-linked N-acetylglucosamine transferase family protein [Rhodanobacter geophilus]|uniref:protein O-GlcNAc transferase n=1 Tax=Rhodanobacter geophilus TaxID=3162488 RepID=A0ABV3QQS4_9GAMM